MGLRTYFFLCLSLCKQTVRISGLHSFSEPLNTMFSFSFKAQLKCHLLQAGFQYLSLTLLHSFDFALSLGYYVYTLSPSYPVSSRVGS